MAQLEGGESDRTNGSLNSKFSKLSSDLISRTSTNHISSNLKPLNTNHQSYDFNISKNSEAILSNFKRKARDELAGSKMIYGAAPREKCVGSGRERNLRILNLESNDDEANVGDFLSQKINIGRYESHQKTEAEESDDLGDPEIDNEYFRNNFETYSEYEKIKNTRLLTKDINFLSKIKSRCNSFQKKRMSGGMNLESSNGVKVNNFLSSNTSIRSRVRD